MACGGCVTYWDESRPFVLRILDARDRYLRLDVTNGKQGDISKQKPETSPVLIKALGLLLATTTLLKFLHDFIEVEAGSLLTRRILFERLKKLTDIVLCRDQ